MIEQAVSGADTVEAATIFSLSPLSIPKHRLDMAGASCYCITLIDGSKEVVEACCAAEAAAKLAGKKISVITRQMSCTQEFLQEKQVKKPESEIFVETSVELPDEQNAPALEPFLTLDMPEEKTKNLAELFTPVALRELHNKEEEAASSAATSDKTTSGDSPSDSACLEAKAEDVAVVTDAGTADDVQPNVVNEAQDIEAKDATAVQEAASQGAVEEVELSEEEVAQLLEGGE